MSILSSGSMSKREKIEALIERAHLTFEEAVETLDGYESYLEDRINYRYG